MDSKGKSKRQPSAIIIKEAQQIIDLTRERVFKRWFKEDGVEEQQEKGYIPQDQEEWLIRTGISRLVSGEKPGTCGQREGRVKEKFKYKGNLFVSTQQLSTSIYEGLLSLPGTGEEQEEW